MSIKRVIAILIVLLIALTPVLSLAEGEWVCPTCNTKNNGNFCTECGQAKPAEKEGWICPSCGKINEGNFCSECGEKRPEETTAWICAACGTENEGNFCTECGAAKGVPASQPVVPEPDENAVPSQVFVWTDDDYDMLEEGVWRMLGMSNSLDDAKAGVYYRTPQDSGLSSFFYTIIDGCMYSCADYGYATRIKLSKLTWTDDDTITTVFGGKQSEYQIVCEGSNLYIVDPSYPHTSREKANGKIVKKETYDTIAFEYTVETPPMQAVLSDIADSVAAPANDIVGVWIAESFIRDGVEQTIQEQGLQAIEYAFSNTCAYQSYLYPDGSAELGVFIYERGEDTVKVNDSDKICILEDGCLMVEYSTDVYIRFIPGRIG